MENFVSRSPGSIQCATKKLGFFWHLVTENETWVHHLDPKCKSESTQWKYYGVSAFKEISNSAISWLGSDNSFLGVRRIAYDRLPAFQKDNCWSVLCRTRAQVA